MAMVLWSGVCLNAQKLLVSSPASIAGTYEFTFASTDAASGWGDVAIDSTYINVPVEIADDGSANPTYGCGALLNTTMMGKVALIDRGDCFFSEKALNAQNAGAIICLIVNSDPLGRIGMSGSAPTGPQVNIPVLMVDKSDGDMIRAQVGSGAAITLTPWSFGFDYDIAIEQGQQVQPFNLTQPYFLLEHAADISPDNAYYYEYRGASFFNNYSADTIDTLYHSTHLYDGTTPLFADSSATYIAEDSNTYMPTTNYPTTWPSGFEPDSEGVVVLDELFDMTTLSSNKQYTVENYVEVLQGTGDGFQDDNTKSCTLTITDSIYGKSSMNSDMTTMKIDYAFNPSGVVEWGPILHFPYIVGSDNKEIFMDKVTVPIFLSNRFGYDDLDGKNFTVNVYHWINTDGDSAIDQTELTQNLVASENYSFPAGSIVDPTTRCLVVDVPLFDIDFGEPGVAVEPEGIYWVAVQLDGDTDIGYGVDNSADNRERNRLFIFSSTNASPNSGILSQALITDMFYSGYSNIGQMAMNVTLASRLNTVAVKDVDESLGINVYPNPASNLTHLEVKANGVQDYISYVVMDVTGKIISKDAIKNTSEANFKLDVSKLPTGAYIIKVSTPEGYNTQKFTKK